MNEVIFLACLVVWRIADPTSDPMCIGLLSGKVSESDTLDHATVGDEVHLMVSTFTSSSSKLYNHLTYTSCHVGNFCFAILVMSWDFIKVSEDLGYVLA